MKKSCEMSEVSLICIDMCVFACSCSPPCVCNWIIWCSWSRLRGNLSNVLWWVVWKFKDLILFLAWLHHQNLWVYEEPSLVLLWKGTKCSDHFPIKVQICQPLNEQSFAQECQRFVLSFILYISKKRSVFFSRPIETVNELTDLEGVKVA